MKRTRSRRRIEIEIAPEIGRGEETKTVTVKEVKKEMTEIEEKIRGEMNVTDLGVGTAETDTEVRIGVKDADQETGTNAEGLKRTNAEEIQPAGETSVM